MKKRICFIAQFPPPIHGLSKAVDTLYRSELADEFEFEKIDITNNKAFPKTLARITASRADLFYFTISQTRGGNLRDLVILKLLRMQHKKCLVHLHGGHYRDLVEKEMPAWQKKANYRAVGALAGAIVLGDTLKNQFQGMIAGDRIFVVPNSVEDECLISDEEFEQKVARASSSKIRHVLYLSNFLWAKGYPQVLELANLEKERCMAGGEQLLHFDFAGKFFNAEDETYFSRYITTHHLVDYIKYHGVVVGDKKKELLLNSDFFMLLSQNEGQPISILEAMGDGLVIFTTDAGGIPDVVQDGVNGFVAPTDRINAREIYKKLIDQAEYCQIMRRNRETVLRQYRQENYFAEMRDVFKTLADG